MLKKHLTNKEWEEIVGLEYVLTWGYSDDREKDLKRYNKLCEKRYNNRKAVSEAVRHDVILGDHGKRD